MATVAALITSPPLALASGWLIFLIAVIVFFFAVVFGYYTVKGSGISLTPYRQKGGPPESPPEIAHDITQDVRNWERGTGGHHGRHRPPAESQPVDPDVAAALSQWRGSERRPKLDPPVGPEDHVVGPDGARTVAMYVDLASEPCRSAWRLVGDLARQQPIRLAIRHLPLADVHALALPAAEALEAAAAQDRFFDALDRLAGGGFTDEAGVLALAAESVADPDRLRTEASSGRYRARIVSQINQAAASGAHVVPEVFIDGQHYDGELKHDALVRALSG